MKGDTLVSSPSRILEVSPFVSAQNIIINNDETNPKVQEDNSAEAASEIQEEIISEKQPHESYKLPPRSTRGVAPKRYELEYEPRQGGGSLQKLKLLKQQFTQKEFPTYEKKLREIKKMEGSHAN